MASGDTLVQLFPNGADGAPSTNRAGSDTRNGHPILAFDQTTQESAIWTFIMPRHYGSGGITITVHWMAATGVTTGTVTWDAALERMSDGSTVLDSDSFAAAQSSSAVTVPGTSGIETTSTVAMTDGAQMDGVTAADTARLRIRRVIGGSAAGDAQITGVEIRET
jgi:hypothetical protein